MSRGFKKVYFIERQAQLDELWHDLRAAGFAGTFIVQELIGGDDTYMDSVTLYIDSNGRPTLFGGANVLLEDHAPSMLGNPVAMITTSMPEVWQRCAEMLCAVGYRGYANFDVKRDPKTGRMLFLEVNPRIGRNSYYVCAAGVNPMRACVEDLVRGRALDPMRAENEILYTLVPLRLLRHYVRDEQLRARMERLVREGKVFDPQRYDKDRSIRRVPMCSSPSGTRCANSSATIPSPRTPRSSCTRKWSLPACACEHGVAERLEPASGVSRDDSRSLPERLPPACIPRPNRCPPACIPRP